ncbi:sensor histidine kinase [Brevundimonas sp. NPDC003935]|uniref:sensor histidine kinase n=1 Tax=unclassified Brevundimonas TaxID=2622653 RepID=UPI00367AE0F2
MKRIRPALRTFGAFLRTPTLSRSIIALLALAILLLLAVNAATFVMIRRTSAYNDTVDHSQQVRLASKDVLSLLADAETGQRGFMLTARAEYLGVHNRAVAELPAVLARLEDLIGDDEELKPRIARVETLYHQRMTLMDHTIALTRTGRIGEAVSQIRSGQGKALMDAMRVELTAIDAVEARRLVERTRQSERASAVTVSVNALAALLILILAGISVWLVRRYVEEIESARMELDRLNAGLENQVRDRTAELTRANEEIQRFAYIVSHDLRAPLVNVMGYTSELEQVGKIFDHQLTTLAQRHPEDIEPEAIRAVREDVPEAVGFIRASTAKMDGLINAILKLSREGRRALVPEVLPMTAVVQSIADSLHHQVAESGGEIIVRDLPPLESDRLSIEQIFGNLLDNAVKYRQPDRPVRIVVEGDMTDDGRVHYRITDNGRGVSARDHERIFELFRRAGKQDQPGEGLGLAFVRNSVRRLGGIMELESELGQGSTFHLKFPTRLIVSGDAGDRL